MIYSRVDAYILTTINRVRGNSDYTNLIVYTFDEYRASTDSPKSNGKLFMYSLLNKWLPVRGRSETNRESSVVFEEPGKSRRNDENKFVKDNLRRESKINSTILRH